MPNENNETRRQRNEAQNEPSPQIDIPLKGLYLWRWYFEISDMFSRVTDGVCRQIPPSEFLAWATLSGNVVYPHEYDILKAMDAAYCTELNKELQDYRVRKDEEQKRDLESKSKRRGK